MVELELLGLHSDGEHLVLTDSHGERYRVLIDDALRAAVRRDRPHLEHLQAQRDSSLRPKDIQSLVRAGASAQEIAEQHGLPVEQVRRYEGPVLAERAWVVQQAQAIRINHDADAPQLGDTVVDRLATRGVSPASLDWDAVRTQGEPWEVAVTFVVDGKEREARWRVDLSARTVHAVDDEARWLSETQVGPGPVTPRRRLNTVGSAAQVFDQEADQPDQTESLLAHLAESRGTRTQPDVDLEENETGTAPLWDAGAHPPASRPEEAFDAHVLPLRGPRSASADEAGDVPAVEPSEENHAEGADPVEPAVPVRPKQRSRKQGRRSVPSWDEIVFGARPE